jgi:hypothetical protein
MLCARSLLASLCKELVQETAVPTMQWKSGMAEELFGVSRGRLNRREMAKRPVVSRAFYGSGLCGKDDATCQQTRQQSQHQIPRLNHSTANVGVTLANSRTG